MDGFAKVITIVDTEKNNWSLSIQLYVRESESADAVDMRPVAECAVAWIEAAFETQMAYDDLKLLLGGEDDEG